LEEWGLKNGRFSGSQAHIESALMTREKALNYSDVVREAEGVVSEFTS
jgi:hypothetical protein